MILNWVADTFTQSDIIDLYFVASDLIDIPITDDEKFEMACGDTMAMRAVENLNGNEYTGVPLGKLVL
jgi:hypothetical protein